MNAKAHSILPASSATRTAIRTGYALDEAEAVREMAELLDLSAERRQTVSDNAAQLIQRVRDDTDLTMIEAFLDEYGL